MHDQRARLASHVFNDHQSLGKFTFSIMDDFWPRHNAMIRNEVLPLVIQAVGWYVRPLYDKTPARTSFQTGAKYVQEILEEDPSVVQELLRMPLCVFESLHAVMLDKDLLSSSKYIDVLEKLAIFLVAVGLGQSNRRLQDRFQHSGETISRIFNEVLTAVARLSLDYVRLPASDQQLATRIRDDPKYFPYFDNCLGALDGTHIDAHVPTEDQRAFRNRKGRLSQNVLGVCSFDMEFLYVLAGWEGCAHDKQVLQHAVDQKGFVVPPGKYYLGDADYSNSDIVLAPYPGIRYHRKEQTLASLRPENPMELFNLRHASLRNAIDRSFGVLKRRFQMLRTAPQFPIKTQVMLMYALCGLHNFIRQNDVEDEDGFDQEPVDIDEDTSEDNPCWFPFSDDSPAMAERRDQMATGMWRDYQAHSRR